MSVTTSSRRVVSETCERLCSDCPGKGGGVAIYVKSSLPVLLSTSAPKHFEMIVSLDLSGGQFLTIVRCYRPPSATTDNLSFLGLVFTCI